MTYYILVIIGYIIVIADALRDKGVDRRIGWWNWHIKKWIAFYLPFGVIIFFMYITHLLNTWKDFLILGVYALSCTVIWRIAYRTKR